MDDSQKCPKCEGTRHLFVNGGWSRCSCLAEKLKEDAYAKAGLTYSLESLDLDKLSMGDINHNVLVQAKAINAAFLQKKLPKYIWCFQGSPTSQKDFIVQSILKSAIDSGLKVGQFSMDDIINESFSKENRRPLSSMFSAYSVFSLSFGAESQRKMGHSILQELLRFHWAFNGKKALLLHTTLPFGDLCAKYGDSIRQLIINDSGLNYMDSDKKVRFLPVSD